MKCKLLFVLLFLFTGVTAFSQKPLFNIKYSEQLAVFVFVENLSANYPENPFKAAFNVSKYNNELYKSLVTEFDTLAIDYTYQFTDYPYGSKLPGMTKELIKKNLIATQTLSDFKLRTAGVVPNNPLTRFTFILEKFTPIYNELIYSPNKKQFENQLAEIIKYSNREDISKYFDTGLTFYNASWDSAIPFEIAFYPLPNSEGFTAQAFYNNFISAIEVSLTDYKGLFSVMLHEIFHIIYDEQSLAVKNKLYTDFKNNPSKNSIYAYLLLNEVLATAMGNGYVYEKLDGKPDPENWYNNKYINGMAKKIYPLVKEYINQKKPFDKAFVDAYLLIYDTDFPGWINEMNNIMTYRYILSENTGDFDAIRKVYRRRSMSEEDNQITDASVEKIKATPLTKIIIVSNGNAEKLALLKRKFSELKNWKYKAGSEFTYTVLLKDKTHLFIVNQKTTPTETLIKNLKVN